MDWTLIVLVIILFALWGIKSSLDNITNVIANKPNPTPPQPPDLSGVEEQLENIYKILGGEVKIKETRSKRHKEHYSLLVKALVLSGKTQKQAEKEANGYLEENDFDETIAEDYTEFMHYTHPDKAISALKWAKYQFIEDKNKKKYGELLPKAREFIKGKTIIQPNEMGKLKEEVKTDYEGEKWLIEKLIQEKRLKEVKEYHYDEPDKLKHYEVLEVEK